MAHFAKINENNIVEQVIVADDIQWCIDNLGGEWIQTSYNTYRGVHTQGGTPLRKNYAGIGYIYDSERDAFIPPQPYPSWVLEEETCHWNSPAPKPEDDKLYVWDEEKVAWVEKQIN